MMRRIIIVATRIVRLIMKHYSCPLSESPSTTKQRQIMAPEAIKEAARGMTLAPWKNSEGPIME